MFTPAGASVPFSLAGTPSTLNSSPMHFAPVNTPTGQASVASAAASMRSADAEDIASGLARTVAAAAFGAGMFPGVHGARVVGHFPTAAARLADAGLSKSAQLWLEMGLTFYSSGLAAVEAGTHPKHQSFKPQLGEANLLPQPGQTEGYTHLHQWSCISI
jgi:hypothetical protein